MSLQERIARGERAIAQAKALGRDVSSWEDHLASLRAAAKSVGKFPSFTSGIGNEVNEGKDDPLLTPEQWYPEFHRFHVHVCHEIPDFDRLWVKQHRSHLYQKIKSLENQIDALGEAKLSEVMVIMREWRELILSAEFEWKETQRAHSSRAGG